MGEPSPDDVRARLPPWYDANRRDLPWRRTRDPYRILVAEYLLQRTRIKSGTPYYERFLKRFPTVQDLAAAPLDDVLAVWEGLGFYGRARSEEYTSELQSPCNLVCRLLLEKKNIK